MESVLRIANNQIVEAQAKFTLNLLNNVIKQQESLILSPISILTVLSIIYLKSNNTISSELSQLLVDDSNFIESDIIHQYYGNLMSKNKKNNNLKDSNFYDYESDIKKYELDIVNQLYFDKNLKIKEKYKKLIEQYYGYDALKEVDFENNLNHSIKVI